MPVEPIHLSALGIDLSARIATTTTVAASPGAAAEVVIASVTIPNFGAIQVVSGVLVMGYAAYTIGTSGVSCQMRLRQTGLAGTVVANSGAQTGGHNTAGQLVADDINGFDSGAGVATYAMTLQVASGAAASTVSSAWLIAIVI